MQQQLHESEKRADELQVEAKRLDQEISGLQEALIAAVGKVQKRESEVSDLEQTLVALAELEAAKEATLTAERADLAQVLMALQRLSTRPRQFALFSGNRVIDEARALRLLSLITPALDARARAVRSELNELKELGDEMNARRDELNAAISGLATENERLNELLAAKASLRRLTQAERVAAARRLAGLAEQSRTLQDLIQRLGDSRPGASAGTGAAAAAAPADQAESGPELASAEIPTGAKSANQRPFPANFIGVVAPARGKLVRRFGTSTETEGQMKGALIETRPKAQIVAPFDGRIVFEGPFRSYGEILIIEHAGGYHTILAGLDRVEAEIGQWLEAGEPVGRMGQTGELGPGQSTPGRPRLYVELRQGGQPIDPAPMLSAGNNSKGQ